MKGNEKAWLYGVIGFLLGIVITVFTAANAVNNEMTGMMRIMGMNTNIVEKGGEKIMMNHGMSMGMDEMTEALKGKSGDEFDKAFIDLMIDHHQGAIDMANLAKQSAAHDEIKNLADDIVNAQTKEIDMMREWWKAWGY